MVFVLDRHRKPLMPCTEKRARQLLERGRAVVHKMAPFTIRLKGWAAAACAVNTHRHGVPRFGESRATPTGEIRGDPVRVRHRQNR